MKERPEMVAEISALVRKAYGIDDSESAEEGQEELPLEENS